MGVSVVHMRPLWTDDIPSKVLKLVHKEIFLTRPDNAHFEVNSAGHGPSHVSLWTSLWTSPAKKKRPTDFPRTVNVGVAEGDTCGPRALTVRTPATDTMD